KKTSKAIQDILNLPKDERKNALEASPLLYEELCSFLEAVDVRLSQTEKDYICNCNNKELAESIGVSEHKAKTVISTVNEAKKVCRQLQELKV
ncbi:MAG: type IV secretion system effector protein, partial [Bartonella sp.]|nr:type IV secretion system effector protein [Bartonella sp.]